MEQRRKVLGPIFSWEAQIQSCRSMEGWESKRADSTIEAIHYLRNILGEHFPEEVLGNEHPIGDFIFNNVPWAKERLSWIATSLQELYGGQNYKTVLENLRSPDKARFEDAMTKLFYGSKFKQAGYQVDFEMPVVNRQRKSKRPDLKVTCPETGEIFYCEITRLQKASDSLLYESVIDRIIHGGIAHGRMLRFAGKMHRHLPEKEFKTLLPEIDQLVRKAAQTGQLQQWIIAGVMELAVSDYNDTVLEEWANHRRLVVNG